jgi:iron complex outermembrane receptor protein
MNLDLSKYFLRGNAQVRVVGARSASQSNILLNSNSRYELAPYAMIDAALSSAGLYLLGAKRETRFTLSLRNLLGTLVSDPGFVGFDIPLPGRTVLLEIRQSL